MKRQKVSLKIITGSAWFLLLLLLAVVFLLGIIILTLSPRPKETQLETQGSSDAIWEIEEDLAATDLTNLDQELELIEKELNKAEGSGI